MSDETTTTPAAPAATPATTEALAAPVAPSPSIPRPVELIRIEYTNLCARLGQLVYNLNEAEKEKGDLIDAIFALAKEESDLPPSMKKEVNLQAVPPGPAAA
jgi:hypothetical protein